MVTTRALLLLGIVGLLVACQTPPPGLAFPLPARWDGPDTFETPRYVWRVGAEQVTSMTCVTSEGTERSTLRWVAGERQSSGLIEVLMETDGKESGRAYFDETGRLAHATGDDAATLKASQRFVDGFRTRALRRGVPQTLSVPLREMMGPDGLKGLPPGLLDRATMTMTLQYLGQTTFAGRRVAGIQGSGTSSWIVVEPGVEFRARMDNLGYLDVTDGSAPYMANAMTFELRGRVSQQFTGQCQMTLDRVRP